MNKDLKKAVCTDVHRTNVCPLILRTIQGTITNIVNFVNNKYLPLTIIAIFNNMAPMIALVLAYFVLKEKIHMWAIIMIFLTVAGVLLIVLGGA